MVKREIYKVLGSGFLGIVIAMWCLFGSGQSGALRWNDIVSILLFSPVYGIGLVYGFKTVFKIIAGLFKVAAPFMMFRGAPANDGGCFSGCLGVFLKAIAAFFLLQIVFVIGWIAGVVYAGILLKEAQLHDDTIWG